MRVVGSRSGIRHGVSAENGVWCIPDLQRLLEFDSLINLYTAHKTSHQAHCLYKIVLNTILRRSSLVDKSEWVKIGQIIGTEAPWLHVWHYVGGRQQEPSSTEAEYIQVRTPYISA